ncbi:mucin-2 isoform X2 [Ochlerotatus camptorhynchus]|uniref:mucin-2 isoform X2 n=1 Tax=Ochlerotatus camptorhynchus TaxID=644619 RepID=UPI0031D00FC4
MRIMQRKVQNGVAPFRLGPCRSGSNSRSRTFTATLVGLLAVGLLLAAATSPVQGGIIVKRQADDGAATDAPIAAELETSTPAPTTRTVEFQTEDASSPREIEFGYDNEKDVSSEQATVAELRQVAESTEPTEIVPASVTVAPTVPAPKAPPTQPDAPTTVVAPTRDVSPSSTESGEQKFARLRLEQDSPTEAPTLEVIDEEPVATTEQPIDEATTTVSIVEEPEVDSSKPVVEAEAEDEVNVPRFDLDRYTSPSNFSQGGISLDESRAVREQFFAEKSTATTEAPLSFWETTTSLDMLIASEELVTESNEVVVVPDALVDRNHTIESNRSVTAEKLEIETNDYELVSNEVRGQNQTTAQPGKAQKKGKFLDQFGATEDNDINGAAWALAGMRIVDRTSSKAGQASGESVEVVRDENENSVANNTLKQLMDWAMIVQDADFANNSFAKPTTSDLEIELKNEIKDRRKYANKTPVDALSEENRITSVVTELIPEASVEVTTVLPIAKLVAEPTSTTLPADDDLEDFKFEDRSKIPLETTKRPELTNFIQETTTAFIAKTEQVVTTVRPTRGYEVFENIDESESFALPGKSTTTGRYESSTTIEDIPVTTYSPASPIVKKIEITTEAILPTTFESMRTTRRPVITTTPEPMTTNSVRFIEETTPQLTTTMTTSTSTVATPASEENESLSNSLPRNSDEQVSSSEVDPNAINQTNEELAMTTSTNGPPTTGLSVRNTSDNIMTQQSTIQPTLIEFRPTTGTTDKVDLSPGQTTETAEEPTIPNQPVLIDDKNVYDTVSETTPNPIPEPEPSASPEPEPSASPEPEPTATTRRSIERQMTTTELSEEESVTEEDYIEVSSGGSSSRSPLDQNQTTPAPPQPEEEEGSGVVVAVVASLVSVIVVLLLVAAFLIFRKRQAQVSYGQRCRPVGLDAYSLDNVSVYNSVRRKGNTMRMSKRSYGNSAFEDPGLKTNPLTVAELANIIQNKTAIYDEFKEIPNVTARADEVPEGCEEKNRYANVVPLPETRVHLKRINDDEKTEYINANFVKGPKDNVNYYIACQAPMENTINDFWRMIWEQNSKVIIMATDLSESGVEKCAEYLPPSVVLDNNRAFGDFQLTLKSRENKEKYTISTVHLRNTQTNTWREIMHFWYQWPDTGVPIDESSIIAMLLEARSYSRLAPGELADATSNNGVNNNNSTTNTVVISNGINGGITSIAEEPTSVDTTESSSVAIGSINVDSSNNNNNTMGKTTSDGAPPSSLMSNGGTMDKHKSLQRTQGPITVHCSPGTGRTGTIVACDVALRAVEIPPRTVDVPHIVYYVRRGRASSVRTREQYELIYRVANVYATKLTGPTIET